MKKTFFLVWCVLLISGSVAFSQDDDGDGIDNTIEISIGTDPNDPDTDNDGLKDGAEDINQDGILDASETNPLDADTDDDGISDGEEVTFSLNNRNADSDSDGLTDGLEIGRTSRGIPGGTSNFLSIPYRGTAGTWTGDTDPTSKTDPLDSDSDHDGLIDGSEDADKDGLNDATETNPCDADTDDDGINDKEEGTFALNKLKADTDNDGLTDGLEIGRTSPGIPGGTSSGAYALNRVSYYGTSGSWTGDTNSATRTDPSDSDTDEDGITDGNEDKDHDGFMDADETNPVDADTDDDCIKDGNEDLDKDGVLDEAETDPLDSDTDDDGLKDGLEKGLTTAVAGGTSRGAYTGNRVSFFGTAAGWTADADPLTVTDPRDSDTDNDGLTDGIEDADKDGLVYFSESDPNDPDSDNDGSLDGVDCANLNPGIYPGATEIPGDGIDQDCNGAELCYLDSDNDGYRPDATSTIASSDCDCDDPGEANFSEPVGDCDDSDATIYPGAPEFCGDGDKNCDGLTLNSSESSINITACSSYTAPDENVYTTSGVKIAVIPNKQGCDSTITINLTINNVDVSVTQNSNILTANANSATYQWLDCKNDYDPILNETNQTFTATADGNYAVEVTQDGCVDKSLCYPVITTTITGNLLTQNILVYPNPTNKMVYIDLGESLPEVTLRIMDTNGRVIKNLSFRDRQILEANIEGPPGIYYVMISSDNKWANIKLLVN